ncbi:MAG: HD domain-containing protein [Candidatus Magnetomorum sp.]|nr:HD domain-containing protein [Candidatus Magnetomorum sp.]
MDIALYWQWFDHFTDQFLYHDSEKDYPFVLKKIHTRGVCDVILLICEELDVSPDVRYLAQLIALFHDLGRFEQYARYGTFRDKDSVNHAIQSIRDLAYHRVLKELSLKQRRIICNAIRYHNVACIPQKKDDETLFYMRLIRDADKLDIWRIFIEYFNNRGTQKNPVIELDVPDHPEMSASILRALLDGKIALISELKTLNDIKLIQLGWIYDLNFRFSFEYVKKNSIIENLMKDLPKSIDIQHIIQKLMDYRDMSLEKKDVINRMDAVY